MHRSALDTFLEKEGEEDVDARMSEEDTEIEECSTPAAAAASSSSHSTVSSSPSSSRSSRPSSFGSPSGHPAASTIDPQVALDLTRRSSQLLLLDLPVRTQIGFDYWSFHVGEKFKGLKMIPPGVHFLWTAPPLPAPSLSGDIEGGRTSPQHMMDPDMVPRCGTFIWFDQQQQPPEVWVRRWDSTCESLERLAPEEESRYIAGARRFDFDQGQGTYPINEHKKWTILTTYITKQLVERLEPIDQVIGLMKPKYKIEDKRPTTTPPTMGESNDNVNRDGDVTMSSSSSIDSSQQPSVSMEDVTHTSAPAATNTSTPTESKSSQPPPLRSSTSFYTRIPSIASLVSSSSLDPAARASRLTELHLDQSELLSLILSKSPATPDPTVDAVWYPLQPSERDLLGEIQFSFVTFLIGQDFEGFEQWKRLIILVTSSCRALPEHHIFYERFLTVFALQFDVMPRDLFIDGLSGDNFLQPCLGRLFQNGEEMMDQIPTSLVYAMKELREKIKHKFMWKFKQLPEFKHRDEIEAEEEEERKKKANQTTTTTMMTTPADGTIAQAPDDEAKLRAFKKRLEEEAEEDEYAPTIAD